MAALGGDLSKQILGQTDAAKAFRPWWDKCEDGIMYSLVVMGKTLGRFVILAKFENRNASKLFEILLAIEAQN